MDERLALAEVGWQKFPALMHLGWAAQWLLYEAELRANLSRPALVVPVFEEEVRAGSRACMHAPGDSMVCHPAGIPSMLAGLVGV